MSRYTVLIYEDESQYATATPEVLGEIMQAHNDFAVKVEELGGKILGGDALQSTGTATSLRRGGSDVTDGPFMETKEVLGGFYLIEAPRPGRRPRHRQGLPGAARRRRGAAGLGFD